MYVIYKRTDILQYNGLSTLNLHDDHNMCAQHLNETKFTSSFQFNSIQIKRKIKKN